MTVFQVRKGTVQGGDVGSPVRMLKRPWWNGHSISLPSTNPSERRPGPWVQSSWVTQYCPSTSNTAKSSPFISVLNGCSGQTSLVRQSLKSVLILSKTFSRKQAQRTAFKKFVYRTFVIIHKPARLGQLQPLGPSAGRTL